MNDLNLLIQKEYELNLKITPFGGNLTRNNIFLGESDIGNSYIIKLESIGRIKQVELSIKVVEILNNTNEILSSCFIKSKNGEQYVLFNNKVLTVQVKENVLPITFYIDKEIISLGKVIGLFHTIFEKNKVLKFDSSDFYFDFKVGFPVQGYKQVKLLSEYDKNNIKVFAMRFLYKRENWYNFWSLQGNQNLRKLIPETLKKQEILKMALL